LIASLRPNYLKHIRVDNGDLPEESCGKREELATGSDLDLAPGAMRSQPEAIPTPITRLPTSV